MATPLFDAERRRLVDLAAKNRLPTAYSTRSYVEAGGLMSYGPDIADLFRRAATYVDKILKGARPKCRCPLSSRRSSSGDQSQNRQGLRAHHPAVTAGTWGIRS